MVLSHWHLDHFWGIEATLKHNPRLTLYAPDTWSEQDRFLLAGNGSIETLNRKGNRFKTGESTWDWPDLSKKI